MNKTYSEEISSLVWLLKDYFNSHEMRHLTIFKCIDSNFTIASSELRYSKIS